MAPSFTIDFSDDFDAPPAQVASATTTTTKRNLLVAPPSVAAHEEKLRDVFTTFDRSTTDLQMLDRLSAGLVTLPAAIYDLVLVLTDSDRQAETLELLTRDVFGVLVPSMKPGAKLQLQHGNLGPSQSREAILAGLVEKDGALVKFEEEEAVVPLRFGANKKKDVTPKTVAAPIGVVMVDPDDDLDDFEDDDELIDENELLTEEDLKRGPQARKHISPFRYCHELA
jgi:hypothetical protein